MVKFILLIVFPFTIIISAFGQQNAKIHVVIDELENDTIYIWRYPLSNIKAMEQDTIIAHNNAFNYPTPEVPTALAIVPKKIIHQRESGGFYVPQTKFIELFSLPGEEIQIQGQIEEYYLDYRITGNNVSQELAAFRKNYKSPAIEAVRIELKIDSLQGDSSNKNRVEQLFDERGNYFSQISQTKMNYVENNLNRDLAAYYIANSSVDAVATYYPKLSSEVRNGLFKDVLNHSYQDYVDFTATSEAEKQLQEGQVVPDFTLKNQHGESISLSDFSGKFIVLDFWGTWCSPCLAELPELKAFHEKYQDDIELISIACNQDEDEWSKLIHEEDLAWLQLLNTDRDRVSIMFGVKAFPTKIILDQNLQYVGRFVGSDDKFYQEITQLVK